MNSQHGNALTSLCSGAENLVIAAPYIKVDALSRVLADVSPTASLICITRWNPQDLVVGASDIECRTIINDRGGSFRLHPSLHAKYYRIDNEVLIGSANLTSPAMGWSPQPNLEILCRAGDDLDACAFQQELLKDAREISDGEFTHWEKIIKINARIDNPIAGDQPLLDAWRPATRDPRHLELAYQDRMEEIASRDEQRAAKFDIEAMSVPPGLMEEEFRTWISTCLLAIPFTNSVIRLYGKDSASASRVLAGTYSLGITDARRDMETVQNWLAFLMPDSLSLEL